MGLNLDGLELNQCALGPAPPAGTSQEHRFSSRRTLYQSPGAAGHKCPVQTEVSCFTRMVYCFQIAK